MLPILGEECRLGSVEEVFLSAKKIFPWESKGGSAKVKARMGLKLELNHRDVGEGGPSKRGRSPTGPVPSGKKLTGVMGRGGKQQKT